MILLSAASLSACGTTKTDPIPVVVVRENYVVAKPDETLRNCQTRPSRPAVIDNVAVGQLIGRLDERGEDCADKLARTWQSIDEATAQAERLNQD